MKLLIKNISKRDIVLGDLRYKIPAGATRDFLSPNSGLRPKDVEKSFKEGSIAKRLGSTLIHIQRTVHYFTPSKNDKIKGQGSKRTRNRKSAIQADQAEVSQELQELALLDDEDLLRELDATESGGVPTIAPDEEKDDG